MPNRRKPKSSDLAASLPKTPPERREDGPQSKQSHYRDHFKAPDTVAVATRLPREEREALEAHAIEQDRRLADILRDWIHEGMRRDGVST